jgi:hypothetical protein
VSPSKEEFQWDVFISYGHADSDIALRIRTALTKKGVDRVWIDVEQILPGDVFVKKIEDGLERSSAVAILISPASLASGWVEEEYTRAISLTKRLRNSVRVIPVVIKAASVPGFLASRSWVDFQDESRFDANIDLLAKGILRRPTDGDDSKITNATVRLLLSTISFLWFFPEGMLAGLYRHLIDEMGLTTADSQAMSRGMVQPLSNAGLAMVGADIEIVRELRALIKDPAKSAKELLTSIQRWVNESGVFHNMAGLGVGRALLIRDLLTLAQSLTTDDGNDNLRSWVCQTAHNYLPDVAEQHLRIGVEISKGLLSADCPQTASDYLVLAHLLLRIGEARQAADIYEIYRGSDLFDQLGLSEEKRFNFALDWAKATKDAGRGRQMHGELIEAYDQMLKLLRQLKTDTNEEKDMIARAEADLLNNTATQIAQFGSSSEWTKAEKSFAQTYDIYRRLKDTDRLLGARANQVAHSLDHLERQKTKPSEEQLRSLIALLEPLNSDAEKTPASENLFFFLYQKARVLKRLYAEDAMQAAEVYKQAADVAEEGGLTQRVPISRCWELRLRKRADEISEDDYLDGLRACAASMRAHTDDAWSSSALVNVLLDIARILRNRRANVEAWNALIEAFDLEARRVVSSQSNASDRLKQILKAMGVVNFTDEQRVAFLGKNAPLLKKFTGVSNHKKLEWSVVTEWLKQ